MIMLNGLQTSCNWWLRGIAVTYLLLSLVVSPLIAAEAKVDKGAIAKVWKKHHNAGRSAFGRGNMTEARNQFQLALIEGDKIYDQTDDNLLNTLEGLGNAAYYVEDYTTAETNLLRAITGKTVRYGAKSHPVGELWTDLAFVYLRQGRIDLAEETFRKALVITELTLGAYHPLVGRSHNGLGGIYYSRSNYAEAEKSLKLALSIAESSSVKYDLNSRIYNSDMVGITQARNNLAEIYRRTDRLNEAEKLYKEVVSITETRHGKTHSEVPNRLFRLALLHLQQKKFAEAEKILLRIQKHSAKAESYEIDAPVTLHALYSAWTDNPKAVTHRQQAMTDLLAYLNLNVAQQPSSIPALANVLTAEGQVESAGAVLTSHLRAQLRLSPDTAELFPAVQTALNLPLTPYSLDMLGDVLQDIVPYYTAKLGEDHEQTLILNAHLLGIANELNRGSDSANKLAYVLLQLERKLGPDHLEVGLAAWSLANAKRQAGHLAEAKANYERAYGLLSKATPANPSRASKLLGQMISLALATGDKDAVAGLMKNLDALIATGVSGDKTELVKLLSEVGEHFLQARQKEQAAATLTHALALNQGAIGAENVMLVPTIEKLRPLTIELQNHAQTEALFRQQMTIYERTFNKQHATWRKVAGDYTRWLKTQGRQNDAAALEAQL